MHAQFNRFELENFSKMAADSYLNEGTSLNEAVIKIARDNDLNRHQVERVSQGANILVNGSLVTKAREDGDDPRVTFPLADSSTIMDGLQEHVHKAAAMRKTAEVRELFTIPRPRETNAIDATLGKLANDPYATGARSLDHVAVTRAYVDEPEKMDKIAGHVTAATLGLACQSLETMEHRALTDHSLAKEAMSSAEIGLRGEIHDQILSGMSPATVRDVIKNAGLDEQTAIYVDGLVTKVAARLRQREGQSAFADGSLVNKTHPLITKSATVMKSVSLAVDRRRGLDKLAEARKRARIHYAHAVREGR